MKAKLSTKSAKGDIVLAIDASVMPDKKEAYILDASGNSIIIKGNSPAGVFNGIQTLRQIIKNNGGVKSVEKGTITDYPAFSWRAFMLDEGRHFKGEKVVLQLLDEMAALKLNTFHWHLTEDQGWRIEIKKYPKLTEIGAYRDSTEIGHFGNNKFDGKRHAPQVGLIDPAAGSVDSIAEALTNIVFAPIVDQLTGVSLSANWMWPCRNEGEDARLYKGVEAASEFAIALGINIPTGKDSLSMTQKYGDDKVIAPGTVIISAEGEVSDVKKIISPVLVNDRNTHLYYIDFSFDSMKLGGSALAQVLNKLGNEVPTVKDPEYFRDAFNAVQDAINKGLILAGHGYSYRNEQTRSRCQCWFQIRWRRSDVRIPLQSGSENW